MISGKKSWQSPRQYESRAVRKWIRRPRRDQSLPFEQIEIGIEGDSSQRQDRSRPDQRNLSFEIRQAIANFFGQGFVVGRRAANRRRNQRVLEDQSIIGAFRARLIGKSRAIKLLVKKIPRPVSRKHSARAIGSVRSGRKADDD